VAGGVFALSEPGTDNFGAKIYQFAGFRRIGALDSRVKPENDIAKLCDKSQLTIMGE